jgi:hypothetical protein
MLPTEDIAILRVELAKPEYRGLTDLECMDRLSARRQIPNPTPAPLVPRPFDAMAVEAMLSPASLGRFATLPLGPRVVECLDSQDLEHSIKWAHGLAAITLPGDTRPIITTAERDAILARLSETIPDPDWPATIPGPRLVETLFGAGKTWQEERPDPFHPGRTQTYTIDFPHEDAIHAARS